MVDYKTFDERFKEDIEQVWQWKLFSEYSKLQDLIQMNLGKYLTAPIFCIDWEMGQKWGEWNPTNRTIRLNVKLFRDFEWEAVLRVLKHEVGHQIVSEVFNFPAHGCSHGEHWKIACQAIKFDNPTRCDSSDFLAGLKSNSDVTETIADKVRKLLSKGSCSGATQEESQIFLNKAQEIMMKHQLTMEDVVGNKVLWIKRPVGPLCERWQGWLFDIAHILKEHYNVEIIRSYAYRKVNGYNKCHYYLEVFGEASNVDVAEYVFYALYNNARWLYKQAVNEHKEKMKSDKDYALRHSNWDGRARRFTEASFIRGLMQEFGRKLREQKRVVQDSIGDEKYTLVAQKNDKLLREMYEGAYPNLRNIAGSVYTSGSSSAGRAAAGQMRLSSAVRGGHNNGRLLS